MTCNKFEEQVKGAIQEDRTTAGERVGHVGSRHVAGKGTCVFVFPHVIAGRYLGRLLFSGLYHHVIWWKFENVSENPAISIIRVDKSTAMMRQRVSVISSHVSTKLHSDTLQTTEISNIRLS